MNFENGFIWKNEIVKTVSDHYNEPLLNLHFLGPYLKNHSASICSYELIFELVSIISQKERTQLIQNLTTDIDNYKKKLITEINEKGERDRENIIKILPMFHILINLIVNFKFTDNKNAFANLSESSHELRLMPLPYGLLPHQLIEIVDNERILPGISKIYQIGEDFPGLNNYQFGKIHGPEYKD